MTTPNPTHYSDKCIHLQPAMEKQKLETTFLHECIHAMLTESGAARVHDKYTEEEVCKFLAPEIFNDRHS